MATGILRKWGLGVELGFNAGRAEARMSRTGRAVLSLREGYQNLGTTVDRVASGLSKLGMVAGPLGAMFGFLATRASGLAADLEAQGLTFRILLRSQEKAEALMARIHTLASSTPFQEGDLIEGSKRLLRLTGRNTDANVDLLNTMMELTALNPSKTLTDAVEGLLDATSGGGFERLKEFGFSLRAEDFAAAGRPGGKAWADAVVQAIRDRLHEIVGDADLIGELSRTFSGRISTLKDAVANVLRELGKTLNEELGPLLEPATAMINGLVPAFQGGALRLVAIIRGLAAGAAPYLERLWAVWEGLGLQGQETAALIVLAAGAIAAAVTPLGGALVVLGLVVSGLVTLGSALAPLASTATLQALGSLALVLGVVAAGAMAFFRMFRREGEAPLAFLRRMGTALVTQVLDTMRRARTLGQAFLDGFLSTFGALEPAIQRVAPPLRQLLVDVVNLFASMTGGAKSSTATWHMLGQVIGMVADFLVARLAVALELVISVVDILRTTFEPLIRSVFLFVDGLAGLVTGAYDAETAMGRMLTGVAGVAMGLIAAVFSLLLGAMETTVRALMVAVAGLPGSDFILSVLDEGVGGLGDIRRGFSDEISKAIAGVDQAEAGRQRERGLTAQRPVVVQSPEDQRPIEVTSKVEIDGREVAEATGRHQVRQSGRKGQAMPDTQRGLVLRGDMTITPLGATEILPAS